MGNNTPNPHPYWGRALQYQQGQQQGKPQVKQQQQQRRQPQGKVQVQEDFTDDWMRKHVIARVVEGANVATIEGVVEDVSRYWIKLRVGGEILYVNKAHIISIRFAEVKEPVGGSNAGKQ